MPTQGGPSRRSHTKSRKGCRTCKRRHIRCDETFPQCRNCTKHQVRCDYMESAGTDVEGGQQSPEPAHIALTPRSESLIDAWQQSGNFPYPDLHVFPPPPVHAYSRDELRLIHHLSAISNHLISKGTSDLTIWAQKIPRFTSLASSYPYVMQALLSFSANFLAWTRDSKETRNLHIHYGTSALGGLHEAIGSFSESNADAALGASLLLAWQATDWRSWSSLRSGIQSILASMRHTKHQSLFAEFITEEELVAEAYRTHRRSPSVSAAERNAILQAAIQALQRLQVALVGQAAEGHWIEQLLTYIQTLSTLDAPHSPEEQFNQLYHLRKWLFWVPVSLMQRQNGQGPALLTLAHFYATALALEPLFPDLGPCFCAAMSAAPLDAIIGFTDAMRTDAIVASLMHWPQQTALSYRARSLHQPTPVRPLPAFELGPETLGYASIGNLSPAFAPVTPSYAAPAPASMGPVAGSSFLEVPAMHPGFAYGTETWGAAPSPGFPATGGLSGDNEPDDVDLYDYMAAATPQYMAAGGQFAGSAHFRPGSHGNTPGAYGDDDLDLQPHPRH